MVEHKLIIQNRYGLHARPAALFVEIASKYDADVKIIKDGVEVNGKSIMGLLILAAEKGNEIILRSNGKDEADLIQALVALLEGKFNEE